MPSIPRTIEDVRWLPLLVLAACDYSPQSVTSNGDASSDAADVDPPANPIVADPFTSARSDDQVSSLTVEHTVGSGPDRLLLVGISTSFGNSIVTSVAADGVPLARIGQRKAPSQDGRVEIWSLLAPDAGTATIAITLDDASSTVVAGVGSFQHVDQAQPLGAFISAAAMTGDPAVAVASAAGSLAFGVVAWNGGSGGTLTDDPAQQPTWNQISGSIVGAGATSTASSLRWIADTANDSWATAAVSVLPQ
jgi:hypothetical protein